ncbi:MAG: hypothetical protein Q9166_003374 [cf. Caloplaca sp. 2 TL-2023]
MSTSAVGWQVDLPGLSSLVLNMGAAGLKKFAQAGVDVHTLLCMGEIAEVCPASPEYRRDISICRQQQRKQSIWLYKVVEIGTASNFIADELLKKRAGENIIALMSTILPLISEEDCDMFILKLFEAYKVHADKTPGFSQLQAFRDSILPLARQTPFKDKTYQYHMLLCGLRSDMIHKVHSSLPSVDTLVHLVQLFERMSQGDPKHILSYHGWVGAAWVIAYARHVLGLPVCVLRTPQAPVPINGEYQDARVLVYISEDEARCELLVAGVVDDLIVPNAQDSTLHNRWMIDLNNVNLHELYLPCDPTYDQAISTITVSLTMRFIKQVVNDLDQARNDSYPKTSKWLQGYFSYCLPQIERRGLRVLEKMGFRISQDTNLDRNTWKDFVVIQDEAKLDQIDISPGPLLLQCSLAGKDRSDAKHLTFTEAGRRVVCLSIWVACIAPWLALSNWGDNLHLISTQVLADGNRAIDAISPKVTSDGLDTVKICLGYWESQRHSVKYLFAIPRLHDRVSAITKQLLYIVVGEKWPEAATNVCARENHGIVLTRAAAGRYSIDFEAVIVNCYAGHISMLGERKPQIEASMSGANFNARIDLEREIPLKPINAFPELRLITESRLTRTSVQISSRVIMRDRLIRVKNPGFEDDDLITAYVTSSLTSSCSHPYDAPTLPTTTREVHVTHGIDFAELRTAPEDGLTIFMLAVDQNPYGQWISVHSHPRFQTQSPYILQRHMCTGCTIELIKKLYDNRRGSPELKSWYIIPARLEGEAME